MSRVLLEMSMSLDGHVTGPDVSNEEPMGRGGEALHEWMFAGRSPAEARKFQTEHFSGVGAVILGRRMADLGIGPWGEEPVFHAPCFVVTHRAAKTIVKKGGTSYAFVIGGVTEALRRAQEAAGSKDVLVNGGAEINRQFLHAGWLTRFVCIWCPWPWAGGRACSTGRARISAWFQPPQSQPRW